MYEKVLVPLDGSQGAENVLPRLQEMIARGEVRSAILARVARPVPKMIYDYFLDPDTIASSEEAIRREARKYLDEVEQRVVWRGVPHRTQVLAGTSEDTISWFAGKEKVDLILIGERSRKTLFHWPRRCLAYKLMHATPVPVEVYRSAATKE